MGKRRGTSGNIEEATWEIGTGSEPRRGRGSRMQGVGTPKTKTASSACWMQPVDGHFQGTCWEASVVPNVLTPI